MKNIKKFLKSKELNSWGHDIYKTIKEAKLSKIEDIKFVLSKCGIAIQCFNKKIRNNKELALIAVKQNGHSIYFLDKELQKDNEIINHAIKTGRTDTGHKGIKLKFILPDISHWSLHSHSKKFKEEKKGKVKNLKIKESLDRFFTYYTGETVNGVPCGKGTSETYESIKGIDNKVHKIKGKEWVNNYQKSFLKKIKYHNIENKYVGEWKNGMYNGIGELTVYHGPDYFINYDGSPRVFSISIGNFTDGEKNGEFKEYSDLEASDHKEKTWMKKFYKNGYKIKKRKK